ncbi:MAG: PhnD/SsuA/transferrin family substrate-binding protein [Candidatus Solibacter sp.]
MAIGLTIGAAIAIAQTSGASTGVDGHGLRRARLYGVASGKTLNSLNRNDSRAAIKAWFDIVARQRGFLLDSKVDVVDSVMEMRERLQNHSVELLMLSITDYLELESSRLAVPALTHAPSSEGVGLHSYFLLAKTSSSAATISSLRGKSILVSSRNGSNTGLAWIDVLLGSEKPERAASFFASAQVVEKPQACILPLFFGRVDACVVDEVNFNLAKEMNPQVGQLKVLARSRPLIESIITTAEPRPYQNELIEAMLSLHESPGGRQLLTVFRTERLVRIQPGDLDSARELWRDYYRLPGSSPNRPPNAPGPETVHVERPKERY